MAAIARKDDLVNSPDGSGINCASPVATSVDEVNDKKVRANGILIPVAGNKVAAHLLTGCGPDESGLSTFSSTVRIGGKGVGRIGDVYGNNVIAAGSPNVFAGG
jgi:hypothetical protein